MAAHLSPAPRMVIVSGHPTDAEVTAIAAALERHRAPSAATHRPSYPGASRWIRAARLEGRGHAPIRDRAELTP